MFEVSPFYKRDLPVPVLRLTSQLPLSIRGEQQRWSRGHKARGQGQGHKKNPRPRTAFPRIDTLEAKAKDQGRKRKCSPKKKKKKVFTKIFQAISKKKRSSQKFFKRSPRKHVFQNIFQALHEILAIQKLVLSSSRGQANFRGREASRPRT